MTMSLPMLMNNELYVVNLPATNPRHATQASVYYLLVAKLQKTHTKKKSVQYCGWHVCAKHKLLNLDAEDNVWGVIS